MLSPNSKITNNHIQKLVNLLDGHPMLSSNLKKHFPKTILTIIYRHAVKSGIPIKRTTITPKTTGRNSIYYLEKDANLAFEMTTNLYGRVDWKNFGGAILDGEMRDAKNAHTKLQVFIQTIRRKERRKIK
jgi:hypothetical protein